MVLCLSIVLLFGAGVFVVLLFYCIVCLLCVSYCMYALKQSKHLNDNKYIYIFQNQGRSSRLGRASSPTTCRVNSG
jgi:uncharacterized protein involved in cysteine biosynthesis